MNYAEPQQAALGKMLMSHVTPIRAAACAALVLLGTANTEVAHAIPITGQGTWETTLQARDIDGNGTTDAFYDTVLHVTWLADLNLPKTSGAALATNGRMDLDTATQWVANLNYFGISGWRLPTVHPVNGSSWNFQQSHNGSTDIGFAPTGVGWGLASEVGHLFYVTLENLGFCAVDLDPHRCTTQPGYGMKNTGDFTNMPTLPPPPPSGGYVGFWTPGDPTVPTAAPSDIWFNFTDYGYQNWDNKTAEAYILPVRAGDVFASIPEPATLALMAIGLAGIGRSMRRRDTLSKH